MADTAAGGWIGTGASSGRIANVRRVAGLSCEFACGSAGAALIPEQEQ